MDFEALQKKYDEPADSARLHSLKTQYRINEIMLDIADHEAVKRLEEELIQKIGVINQKLLYNDLGEVERKVMMTERDCWLWFVQLFPNLKKSKENIENYIKTLSL